MGLRLDALIGWAKTCGLRLGFTLTLPTFSKKNDAKTRNDLGIGALDRRRSQDRKDGAHEIPTKD